MVRFAFSAVLFFAAGVISCVPTAYQAAKATLAADNILYIVVAGIAFLSGICYHCVLVILYLCIL